MKKQGATVTHASKTTITSNWYTISSWADLIAANTYIRLSGDGYSGAQDMRLSVRPDDLASVKTIPAIRLANGMKRLARRKGSCDEAINKIELLYSRDWSQDRTDTAYRGIAAGSDAVSGIR